MTCVVIETKDGAVSVGALPEDQKPDYGDLLQPVGSVDEALAQAKQLLGQTEQPEQAEGQMQQGFDKAAGPPAGMAQRQPGY